MEFDKETERLIEREVKTGHVPDVQTLINRAVRAYLFSHPVQEGGSISVEDLQARGALGPDGLYEAERPNPPGTRDAGATTRTRARRR